MPFFSPGLLDEVRNSVNIVSLISEYVALKKRGRNYLALCPFHSEKTPSFNVNEEKQIFHCFGCGVGGDAFKFVSLLEHLSFPEAVELLAQRHGIALPARQAPGEAQGGIDTGTLRNAMVEAASFFHRALLESAEGRGALAYLKERGVSEESIKKFQLGYSPAGGEALLQWLNKKGYSNQNLEDCGLVRISEDGRRRYDAFRARIIFPITDIQGRVIAFGGRTLGDAQPKYLNSPETKLYNKSRNLFGLSFSREGIQKLNFATLVEGYMDFLIPFQCGITNVVASLGTSLTPQQVKLLSRYTREVVVSYDPDSAGIAATQRSLDLFLEEEFRVKVLQLPEGQDPDTFIRKTGLEQYRSRLKESTPYLDFVLDTALRSQGVLDSPRKKIQVLNAVLPYLAKLPNAVERSDYVFRFARKLQIEDKLLLAEVKRAAQQKKTRLPDATLASLVSLKKAEKKLLQLLLGDLSLQAVVLPDCSSQDFEGLVAEKLFVKVLERHRSGQVSTFDYLHREFAGEPEQTWLAQMEMEELPEIRSRDTAESCLNTLRGSRLSGHKEQLLAKIAEAAERKDDEMLNRLIEQRVLIDRQLVSLSRK